MIPSKRERLAEVLRRYERAAAPPTAEAATTLLFDVLHQVEDECSSVPWSPGRPEDGRLYPPQLINLPEVLPVLCYKSSSERLYVAPNGAVELRGGQGYRIVFYERAGADGRHLGDFTQAPLDEPPLPTRRAPLRSKRERLDEVFRRYAMSPTQASAESARDLLFKILGEVEDTMSGIPYDPAHPADGRVYPARRVNMPESTPFLLYQSNGERLYFAPNGALEVRGLLDWRRVIYSFPGTDGRYAVEWTGEDLGRYY